MNNYEKKVSVVVPVYNVERYLRECIDSILGQSFSDFELILIDDGSTDKCPQICDEYKKQDERIVVIHQVNSGLSEARNRGIDISKGEWITFIDSDDAVSEEYLSTLTALAENTGAQISICNAWTIEDGIDVGRHQEEDETVVLNSDDAMERLLTYKLPHNAWAKLYHHSLFDGNIRFPIGRKFEDLATTYLLFGCAERVAVSNHKCYGYRISDSSIMSYARTHILKDKRDINDEIARWLVENKPHLLRAHIEGCIIGAVSDMFKIALAGTEADNKEFYVWIRRFIATYGNVVRGYKKERIFITLFSLFPKLLRAYPSVRKERKLIYCSE